MRFLRKKAEQEQGQNRNRRSRRLFRRNQIIITSLAVMIAAAGYLNYAGKQELAAGSSDVVQEAGSLEISDEDLYLENQAVSLEEADGSVPVESLAQIDSWDEGEEAAAEAGGTDEGSVESGMENPGEAILTSGLTVSDYIAGLQLNREQIRARNKETLNEIIDNNNLTDAAKQEAVLNMVALTEISEKENAAETLLSARGFTDPVVSITDGKVDVVIGASSITDQQRAQIEDIVKRKTQVAADGIVISCSGLAE